MLQYAKSNPFRPADWRWQRTIGVLNHTQPNPTRRRDDAGGFKWIRSALRFKIAYDACGDNDLRKFELADSDPALFWAHWMWQQDNHSIKSAVEAYILARQTDFEIGYNCGIPPQVVEAYEEVFFNVREKLNHREYILHCVLGPSIQKGLTESSYDLLWKMYGYFCGPHLLAGLISKFPVPIWCQTPDAVSAAIQDDAISTLKLKAAIATKTVPVNGHTQLALMEQFTKFVEVERSTETSGRAQDQVMEHISVMMSNLPFFAGPNPPNAVDGSPMAEYDQGGVELTYSEQMRVAVRLPIRGSEVLNRLTFPETITTQKELESDKLLGGKKRE